MIRKITVDEIPTINEWFSFHFKQDLPLALLPENGYCNEDFSVACWFELASSTPAAWLLFLCSKPNLAGKDLICALDDLLDGIENVCKSVGHPFIFTTGDKAAYIKYLENRGWEAGHQLTQLCKIVE